MAEERRQFSMNIKVGESVSIDKGRTVMTVMEKSGRQARLAFNAAKEVSVNRIKKNTPAEHAKKGLNA